MGLWEFAHITQGMLREAACVQGCPHLYCLLEAGAQEVANRHQLDEGVHGVGAVGRRNYAPHGASVCTVPLHLHEVDDTRRGAPIQLPGSMRLERRS